MKVAKICKNRNYRFLTLCGYKNGIRICKRVGWSWGLESWFEEMDD